MPRISDQEFNAVSALDGPARYRHFVKRVADWEQVWSIRDSTGWVVSNRAAARQFVPVWPHARYAQACTIGAWQNARAAPIPLSEWMDEWLPRMTARRQRVAVFALPSDHSVSVEPSRHLADLESLLSEWYGDG